ncbi:MAG: DUF2249 domain-containing protein [Magnetococcales bacterium]|nr:DUF2249 domain-containing protein [Magnetococcales bacterium]
MSKNLDVRTLPAPEPMIRILEAVATLYPGETLQVHHSRVPHLLYPRLQERGVSVETRELPDGEVLLSIRRPERPTTP